MADLKTVSVNNTMTLNATDGSTVNFGTGGGAGATVAYSSNTLGSFATTTSTQLRGVVSDSTGTGSLVFSTNPVINTTITTSSTTFSVFNTSALTVNAFGAATALNMGSSSGTTTINNGLTVANNVTLNTTVADLVTINGRTDFVTADITIRDAGRFGISIGRGGGEVKPIPESVMQH